MSLHFLSQNMAQKDPKKKMSLTAANAIIRSAKLALVELHHLKDQLALHWMFLTFIEAPGFEGRDFGGEVAA